MGIVLEGKIERITFFNPQNNYTVAKLLLKNNKLITVIGNFYSINTNQYLKLSGEWKNHPKFGEQFVVSVYEIIQPESLEDIEKYLASGVIKGIGAATAKKIVNKFGLETLNILDERIEELAKIPGLSKAKVADIKEMWQEQKDLRLTGSFLQNLGFNASVAGRIYSILGTDAIEIIKNDPYKLARILPELQFPVLDKIAYNLGFMPETPLRIEAGIIYVLNKYADDGNTYSTLGKLLIDASNSLNVNAETIFNSLADLQAKEKIVAEDCDFSVLPLDLNHPELQKKIYLSEIYDAEAEITEHMLEIFGTEPSVKIKNIEKEISKIQLENEILFSEKQIFAIKEALTHKIVVVTGGPGTGKTTIIKSILKIFNKHEAKIQLAAPTGRAAKRMSESTGYEAKTIHRLLEYNPVEEYFVKDDLNPLEADLLVIDEASMIDTLLFSKLLRAVNYGTTLILIGDVDQLPSIGPGNILKDIIASKTVPTVILTEIFRQSADSLITINAHRINRGERPLLNPDNGFRKDFHFYQISDPDQVVNKVIDLCKQTIPMEFGLNPVNDVQVMVPMHKGTVGVSNLNSVLQNKLNFTEHPVKIGFREFKIGDKVMQNRNNYEKDVFNGDLGRVSAIKKEKDEIFVNFDGRIVKYANVEIDDLILAYAISIHKSQGSEYPAVIIPLLEDHYALLQRNLLYTAITRAKSLVFLVGTERAINIAINRNRAINRLTSLKEKLENSFMHQNL